MPGISAFGAFIPRSRLAREAIAQAHSWALPALKGQAKGARAYCAWDEDPITMAVEAARQALADGDRRSVGHLRMASTSLPYDDLVNGSLVAGALSLRQDLDVLDLASGQRSVTAGLIESLKREHTAQTLFVASDAPAARPGSDQEMQYGAAAAAFVLGGEGVIARLLASHSVTAPFVDHFRAKGEKFDYFWEERWIREEGYLKLIPPAVSTVLKNAQKTAGSIRHLVLASPLNGVAQAVAKKLGIAPEAVVDSMAGDCGYSGAAHVGLMLAAALERAQSGDSILVVGFGQGCDVLLLETTADIARASERKVVAHALARRRQDDAYLRFLSAGRQIEYAWGMRAEKDAKTALTQQYRASTQILGFVGGRCRKCGTVQFPRLGKCVNPQCRAPGALDDQPLSDEPAKLLTFTSDWLQYSPSPPLNVGLVQFDNGARVLMEIVDVDPRALRVGLPVRAVFRIKERDLMRHYDRYFWKAAPVETEAQ